jgi:hypothetical protein
MTATLVTNAQPNRCGAHTILRLTDPIRDLLPSFKEPKQ